MKVSYTKAITALGPILLLGASSANAAIWIGSGNSGSNSRWTTNGNWSPSGVPTSSTLAEFTENGGGTLVDVFSANQAASGITFSGADAHTIQNQNLTLHGSGIVNTSTNLQTLTTALALGTSAQSFTDNGSGGGLNVNTTVNINNFLLTLDGNGTSGSIIGGIISGTGGLTKSGAGTWTLSAANSYSGGTIVSDGTLALSGSGTLGAAAQSVTVSGGILDLGGLNPTARTGTVALTGGAINNGTLTKNGGTFDAQSGNASAILAGTAGLTKTTSGTVTLTGANSYIGTTTVTEGTLIIDGSVASTSVVVDGVLGGSGVMANATLSGSGSINPGNSPGIMTAAATSGGLDYNFEFTLANNAPTWSNASASMNDVLRLTAATPFADTLGGSNIINVYLNVASIDAGDVFQGGFYADNSADFLSSISGATFQYFLLNGGGAITYQGNNYDAYAGPAISVSTVQVASADFAGGSPVLNGYVTQFSVVPEPSTALLGAFGALALLRRRR